MVATCLRVAEALRTGVVVLAGEAPYSRLAYAVLAAVIDRAYVIVVTGERVVGVYAFSCSPVAAFVGAGVVVVTVDHHTAAGARPAGAKVAYCAGVSIVAITRNIIFHAADDGVAVVLSAGVSVVAVGKADARQATAVGALVSHGATISIVAGRAIGDE